MLIGTIGDGAPVRRYGELVCRGDRDGTLAEGENEDADRHQDGQPAHNCDRPPLCKRRRARLDRLEGIELVALLVRH
jgi:hypothetical protein